MAYSINGRLRLLTWALSAVLTLSFAGCGSDDPPGRSEPSSSANSAPPPAPPPPAPTPPQPAEAEDEPEEGTDPPGNNEADGNGTNGQESDPDEESADGEAEGDEQADPEQAEPEEEPPRPEDFAEWKKEDYFAAREENDPRLLEAVAYLGQQFVGKPSVAQGLADMLTPVEVDEDEQKNPPVGQASAKPLIDAVVAALGVNGSDAARLIMTQLLAGKLPSDDDRTAVVAVLKALSDHPSAKSEELLFRALTEADKLRPRADGELKAEDLRKMAFEAVGPIASDGFRTRLARHLFQPDAPSSSSNAEVKKTIGTFLEEDRPANLGAQLILYRSDKITKETQTKLEDYIIRHGSRTLGQILGVSSKTAGQGNSNAGAGQGDPDLAYRAAGQLWAAPWVSLIEGRLAKIDSLDKQEKLFGLALTIPLDSTRSSLLKVLESHWDDGPKTLEAAGMPSTLIGDPGFLLLTKMLAKRRASSRTIGKKAIEKYQASRESWEKFSEALIRSWFDRLHAAASVPVDVIQTEKGPSPEDPAAEDEPPFGLPITLHKEAKVAAAYQASWPDDMAGKLSGVTPGWTALSYVRIEEKLKPKTILANYKRKLQARNTRLDESSAWVESLRIVPQTERKRLIVVLMEGADDKSTREADEKPPEEVNMVIQILAIEINDPEKSRP